MLLSLTWAKGGGVISERMPFHGLAEWFWKRQIMFLSWQSLVVSTVLESRAFQLVCQQSEPWHQSCRLQCPRWSGRLSWLCRRGEISKMLGWKGTGLSCCSATGNCFYFFPSASVWSRCGLELEVTSFGMFRLFLILFDSPRRCPPPRFKPNILSCCWLFPCRVVGPTVIFPIVFLDFAALPLLPELCYLSRLNPGQILFQRRSGPSWGSSSLVKLMTCVLPPRPSLLCSSRLMYSISIYELSLSSCHGSSPKDANSVLLSLKALSAASASLCQLNCCFLPFS